MAIPETNIDALMVTRFNNLKRLCQQLDDQITKKQEEQHEIADKANRAGSLASKTGHDLKILQQRQNSAQEQLTNMLMDNPEVDTVMATPTGFETIGVAMAINCIARILGLDDMLELKVEYRITDGFALSESPEQQFKAALLGWFSVCGVNNVLWTGTDGFMQSSRCDSLLTQLKQNGYASLVIGSHGNPLKLHIQTSTITNIAYDSLGVSIVATVDGIECLIAFKSKSLYAFIAKA